MPDAAFEAYMRHALDHIASLSGQPYDAFAEEYRQAAARHEAWKEEERRRWESVVLHPIRHAMTDVLVDIEAAKAARPAIGKPLSRRARRRNRGRVAAAEVALARVYHEPVTWA